ncbi:hypothetical protein EMCRGX_G026588 [Ephydatia muelleri]
MVANSRHTSHLRKCTHATAAPSSLSLLSVQVADPSLSPLPTFESVCKLPGRTVRHIPLKDRLAFALVLSSALRSAVHDNSEDAWLKLLMLPKCVLLAPKRAGRHHKPVPISRLCAQWSKGEFSALWNRASNHHSPGPMHLTSNHKSSSVQTAVSLAREGLLSKACQTLTSSGLAPDNNTTWNLLVSKHPKGTPPTPPTAPLLAAPYLPPDFNIMAVLHSFPKDTACGPSGLRIQHLIEAAEVPLQFPICAVLREVVNMLISGKVPVQVARFLAGGNLVALEKNKPNCPPDIRPIAVGEAIRRLAGKCLCSMTKAKAHDFLAPFQLGVACQGGAEKIIHGLRSCVDEHWHEVDFAVLKIDLHNAFNRVSRQAVLNACALHIPELLPWSQWCYGQHPALWHSLGTISSEIGVQQGDPLGPLLFCLVLQQIISAIVEDVDCESLLFHHWYIDDGVVAGPVAAIARVLAIIQESGPPLGLNINIAKCELFSSRDLSSFPEEMRRSNVPHFEILGTPIAYIASFLSSGLSPSSGRRSQKVLSSKIEDQQFNNLFHNASVTDRARLLSISSPHASAWLSVTPSPRLNLHLEPAEFQVALKWWLGIPVVQGQSCPHCPSCVLDDFGHHSLTCKHGGDVVSRHNKLRDVFYDFCQRACLGPRLEMGCGAGSDSQSRPADVLVPNWDLGKPAAFDLSVTSTLQSSALLEASVTAGSAAQLAENRKHNNSDKKCDELGWACIPLVVETYGCWGAEAVAALSKLQDVSPSGIMNKSPRPFLACTAA